MYSIIHKKMSFSGKLKTGTLLLHDVVQSVDTSMAISNSILNFNGLVVNGDNTLSININGNVYKIALTPQ